MRRLKKKEGKAKPVVQGLKKGILLMTIWLFSVNSHLQAMAASPTAIPGMKEAETAAKSSGPVKTIYTIAGFLLAIMSAIGLIVLIKNIWEFFNAFQDRDSSTMNQALKGIIAGGCMFFLGAILAILGFTY